MRGSPLDIARRAYLGVTRALVTAASDKPKMQTIDVRLYQNELLPAVERFQPYGHSTVPLPPDQDGKGAEAIVLFINGSRSHPIVIGVDDRRYRTRNGEPGQVGHYHYRGATATFREAGFTHDAGADKKPHLVLVGDKTSVQTADGSHLTKVGSTAILKEDGKITTDTKTKVFTGVVHLGAGGSLSA